MLTILPMVSSRSGPFSSASRPQAKKYLSRIPSLHTRRTRSDGCHDIWNWRRPLSSVHAGSYGTGTSGRSSTQVLSSGIPAAAAFPQVGIGLLGVSLAFGLTVVTMAYAIGHVSGCHLNPAVTVGLAAGGRFPAGHVIPYVVAQVIGAIAASALLYVIASGAAGFDVAKGFASNGYDAHSPGHYNLTSCFIMEV